MDAIQVLKQQHREVEQLFEQCKSLGERAFKSREDLVRQICEKLTIHTQIEHDVFYPAVMRVQEGKSEVLEGLEEHHLVKILLKQLAEMEASDETYMAKLTVLEELVQHHVEEEEEKMFKLAKQSLDQERLQSLGRELLDQTAQLEGQEPAVTITMLDQVGLKTESI
ncbi:MAG: hemerythrin domain-containing protein [Candidatus Sericytochromatia bacterium]